MRNGFLLTRGFGFLVSSGELGKPFPVIFPFGVSRVFPWPVFGTQFFIESELVLVLMANCRIPFCRRLLSFLVVLSEKRASTGALDYPMVSGNVTSR